MSPARLIAVEGIDGSGKSTQARLLADSLGAVSTFQFGATEVGRAVRTLLLDPNDDTLSDRAEALLIVADKAQHVAEIVAPALSAGRDVVSDRFTASTLAYQGYGRGLDLQELRMMMRFATDGIEPDLNLLLDLPVESAVARLGPSPDRFEAGGSRFLQKVRDGYLAMAEADPGRWLVVDAEGSEGQVSVRARAAVRARLGVYRPGVSSQ
ncbi:MAG: dTMP kinase [Acidimicrobiaceae bacterium]|nr:dTMP kinase [Acidimicrobiaceae bacterium]MCY4175843.1 dTMP kinase [Acidimicrobiaceae bacterium]MCY4280557.1 dTMP kinase [Acidimicrobiaceae bacterium]MCY4294780.1 dTMP kinase [Acidimicrobiaceae bacterium]